MISGSDQKIEVLLLATRVPGKLGDGSPSFVLDHAISVSTDCAVTVLAPRMRNARADEQVFAVQVKRFAYFPQRWERLADDAIMPQLRQDKYLWVQALAMTIAMTIEALRLIWQHKPNVIHAHWIYPSGIIAMILGKLFDIPYIITSHGADAFLDLRGAANRLQMLAIGSASRFIAVSHEIHDKFAPSARASTAQPVGTAFSSWEDVMLGRSPRSGQILFIGRLDEKKGLDILLKAISAHSTLRVRIAGDGPLREAMHELARNLSIEGQVTFLGPLARNSLASEMKYAACVAIPSQISRYGDREGTPTVLAECVAAKVPVVASNLGGMAALLRDGYNGLVVEPGDFYGLGNALDRLSMDPYLGLRLAANAYESLRHNLDTAFVARRYVRWYREAIDEG